MSGEASGVQSRREAPGLRERGPAPKKTVSLKAPTPPRSGALRVLSWPSDAAWRAWTRASGFLGFSVVEPPELAFIRTCAY